MQQEVQKLLASTGRTLTLRKLTPGSYSTSTSAVTGAVNNDHSITAHLVGFKNNELGELIRQGDRKALISSVYNNTAIAEPTTKDKIVDGSTVYEILSAQKITKANQVIAYICQVRV